jgi:hypothetical protein
MYDEKKETQRQLDDNYWIGIEGKQYTRKEKSGIEVTAPRAIDLYCWWADIVGFRTAIPSQGSFPTTFSFLADGDVEGFAEWAKEHPRYGIEIPRFYLNAAVVAATPAKFFTFILRLLPKATTRISGGDIEHPATSGDFDQAGLADALRAILACEQLHRVQLGYPLGEYEADKTDFDNSKFVEDEDALPTEKPRTAIVLGVIDDGAAFAHASVRKGVTEDSRVDIVWYQSRRVKLLTRSFWHHPMRSWYGAQMGRDQMASAVKDSKTDGGINELRCYASLRKKTEYRRSLRSRESHGAAVLSAFAGSLNAANVISTGADAEQLSGPRELADAASVAPIVLVDLPYEVTAISSGRWMPGSALDGVRFIVEQARGRYRGVHSEDVPVVINISSGSSGGPHDGHSMFESALTELLEADCRLAVTLAAGNSRLANSHTDVTVKRDGTAEIVVRVPPDKGSETYIEFWPERVADDRPTGQFDCSAISFWVTTPDGRRFKEIHAGKGEAVFRDKAGSAVAGMKFAKNAVQSLDRPMALLVVAPTLQHEWRPVAPAGNWVITCRNASGQDVRIRAWIERDEVVFGIRKPQLAHFVHSGQGKDKVDNWMDSTGYSVSRYDTKSSLANAQGAFAVAAGVGGRDTGYVSPYSGGGSETSESARPHFIARADRNPAQSGIPVFGTYGAARYHMNGTSIAAPLAARWIANYMACGHERPHIDTLAQCSSPRVHPHIRHPDTGAKEIAAGEGRWFVDPTDSSTQLCLGKPLR